MVSTPRARLKYAHDSPMSLNDFPHPTTRRELPIDRKYPLVGAWGKQKISSKATTHGVDQMFADAYGRQHELGLHAHNVGQDPSGKWRFGWELQFYTHPGMRRSIAIEIYEKGRKKKDDPGLTLAEVSELVDRLHAMSSNERLWMAFHTYGLNHGGFQTAKQALLYLRDLGLPWDYAVKSLPKEATEHQPK